MLWVWVWVYNTATVAQICSFSFGDIYGVVGDVVHIGLSSAGLRTFLGLMHGFGHNFRILDTFCGVPKYRRRKIVVK